MGFTTFGLTDPILQGIRAAGHATPTPIQALAITPALAGKDIIGCAQTGTGKTAAFILPILHRLSEQATTTTRPFPRALVLTPTRELAQQVSAASASYGRFLPLRAVAVYGGAPLDKQVKLLHRGADIVVATPGRLIDLLQRRAVDLSHVSFLVLDEADRMLDMGFINDVRTIIAAVPAERQTFMFSATISDDIATLSSRILRNPIQIEAGERRNPVKTIAQHFYATPGNEKMSLLLHALDAERMESVLVFSRTKHGADKIARRLERSGVTTIAIHSNRTQSQREHALSGFKEGKFRVLVATDIAARGIDVVGITHVINYDVPRHAEDYVHRIGRTGRAGSSGDAITFVGNDETDHLRSIERYIGTSLAVKRYPGFVTQPPVAQPPAARSRSTSNAAPSPRKAHRTPGSRTRTPSVAPRKRKPASRTDVFSSDGAGAAWSNW
jgi:ATP-dependent RNA helicase RhlE